MCTSPIYTSYTRYTKTLTPRHRLVVVCKINGLARSEYKRISNMNMQSPGSTAVILRRGAPNSSAIAQQWYQQVRPGKVDSMQISWASVGPIVLMGRLLARVKSVSVAQKKKKNGAVCAIFFAHSFQISGL